MNYNYFIKLSNRGGEFMYYCMQCQSVHEISIPGSILKTGFQTVKGVQLPVGFCQSINSEHVFKNQVLAHNCNMK